MLLKLITIKSSHKKEKKLDAVFEKDGRKKIRKGKENVQRVKRDEIQSPLC